MARAAPMSIFRTSSLPMTNFSSHLNLPTISTFGQAPTQVSYQNNLTPQVSYQNHLTPQVSYQNHLTPQVSYQNNLTPQVSYQNNLTPQVSYQNNLAQQVSYQNNLASQVNFPTPAPAPTPVHSHGHGHSHTLPQVPSNLVGTNFSQFGFGHSTNAAPLFQSFNFPGISQNTSSSTPIIGTAFPGSSTGSTFSSVTCLEDDLAEFALSYGQATGATNAAVEIADTTDLVTPGGALVVSTSKQFYIN